MESFIFCVVSRKSVYLVFNSYKGVTFLHLPMGKQLYSQGLFTEETMRTFIKLNIFEVVPRQIYLIKTSSKSWNFSGKFPQRTFKRFMQKN